MALFVLAVNKGLCATFRTVLVEMRLVHKQSVYAEFLKGDNVVFATLVIQFFQLQFQVLSQLLHLFDGESLRSFLFRLDVYKRQV